MEQKAVGFDFGGVIASKPKVNFNQDVSIILGVNQDEFICSYLKFSNLYNSGAISQKQLWSMVLKDLRCLNKLTKILDYISKLP